MAKLESVTGWAFPSARTIAMKRSAWHTVASTSRSHSWMACAICAGVDPITKVPPGTRTRPDGVVLNVSTPSALPRVDASPRPAHHALGSAGLWALASLVNDRRTSGATAATARQDMD